MTLYPAMKGYHRNKGNHQKEMNGQKNQERFQRWKQKFPNNKDANKKINND